MARTGYERTPPTGGGNVAVVFNIDKSDYIKGIKGAGDALERFEKTSINKTGSSNKLSINVDAGQRQRVSTVAVVALRDALEDSTKEWTKQLAASGKKYFQNIIATAPNRVKPRPGRIDTTTMITKVRGRSIHRANHSIAMVGWDDVYYRYFSFQEDGTRGGPMPMGAVPKTARYLSTEFNRTMSPILKARMDQIK